jgi:putative ABC transport system permease protein
MLVQSLRRQQDVKPGFEVAHLLTAEFEGAQGIQTPEQERDFVRTTLVRARALPGVAVASVATNAPLSGDGMRMSVGIAGYQPTADERMEISFMRAGPDYFAALGVPIVRGIEVSGLGDTLSRVVINEAMARRYWPGRDPIGSSIRLGGPGGRPAEVVGIAADARLQALSQAPAPRFVVQNRAVGGSTLLIRARESPETLIPIVQQTLGESNRAFTLRRIRTMEQTLDSSIVAAKALAGAVALISILALVLAVCGLYAVVSLVSAQRTREFGVRLALGAEPWDLFRLVLGSSARISGIGGVVGLVLSVGAGAALREMLYSVSIVDATTVFVVVLLVSTVVLIATLGPALRASRTSPVEPLRAE